MAKQLFKCENCQNEFEDYYRCTEHEIDCFDENTKVKSNFEKAISKLTEKYQLIVIESRAELYVWDCDGHTSKNVDLYLNGKLPNGNEVAINDSYWSEKLVSEHDFFNEIEEHYIIPKLETYYEGKVWGSRSYDCEYMIGELSVDEICRRFHGKKVRIEIIQ